MTETHLIIGVSGQDGSYLAEHLVAAGHEVHGTVRPGADHRPVTWPLAVQLHQLDLYSARIAQVLDDVDPDVIYNLAARTAPGGRWGTVQPGDLAETTGLGVLQLLQAVERVCPQARVVHASSSAVYDPHRYGLYGVAKQFAHEVVVGYRSQRMHVSNAVLYSHTSPRQDSRFLAPTIVRTLAEIAAGGAERLRLTTPNIRRDWGYAPDFVTALPLIAAADPGDYDVATGLTRSTSDFVDIALRVTGLCWGDAVLWDSSNMPLPVEQQAKLTPVHRLGWSSTTPFQAMVETMVEAATARVRATADPVGGAR